MVEKSVLSTVMNEKVLKGPNEIVADKSIFYFSEKISPGIFVQLVPPVNQCRPRSVHTSALSGLGLCLQTECLSIVYFEKSNNKIQHCHNQYFSHILYTVIV